MNFKEFFCDNISKIILNFISVAVLSVFLILTGTEKGIVSIVIITWAIVVCIVFIVNYISMKSRLNELEMIINSLDEKYLFAECVSKPKRLYEKQLFSLLRKSGKSMIETVSQSQKNQNEYQEYIESWVHEIKVPITVAQLICQNNPSDLSRKIQPAVLQIEEHVERALYYARCSSIEKDFIIQKTSLFDLVTLSLAKHKSLLIQNKVCVETDNLNAVIYTDEKWVSFILGQLLSNAVRYRREEPVIQIKGKIMGKLVQLDILDNGIGIPENEISRVFMRSFSGSNGRSRGGSTGMGLYICKKLCDFLQIRITAESKELVYTKISLIFPAKDLMEN